MSRDFTVFVTSKGTLEERLITGREILYTGRNGKQVERFYTGSGGEATSCIFKPLTNFDTMGREQWVYRHLLPTLHIRYPRLLACADHHDPNRYWSIFEDMGTLLPLNGRSGLLEAARTIPAWHAMPLQLVPQHYRGHTPYIDEILAQIRQKQERVRLMFRTCGLPEASYRKLIDKAAELGDTYPADWVVSHGDLHPGNVSVTDAGLIVFDWEYVHRNHRFWDIYNLLDITDPKLRRDVLDDRQRSECLQAYQSELSARSGWRYHRSDFESDYLVYVGFYSAWILLLIENDLQAAPANSDALLAQRDETCRIVEDCIEHW